MSDKVDELTFDVRVVGHNLRRGVINAEQVQQNLDGLVDEADEGTDTLTTFTSPYWDRYYSPAAADRKLKEQEEKERRDLARERESTAPGRRGRRRR